VSTYNATVFLETLAANFPTLVFFDPGKYEIRQEAVSFMDSLRKVGILHDTPESAARFLNKIGADISEWWKDETLQEIRKVFCQSYAHSAEDWIDIWNRFFRSFLQPTNKV
jgi:putative transferase (TIGR04331 family)